MEADFSEYLNNLQRMTRPAGSMGGRATGGYASNYGNYTLAEGGREFVLNASTTRRLENQTGGMLSQNSFGSLGGVSISANVNGAGMSPSAIAAMAAQQVETQLTQILTDAGRTL